MTSFDLHVLSTPPAFVLSQDQTLVFNPSLISCFAHSSRFNSFLTLLLLFSVSFSRSARASCAPLSVGRSQQRSCILPPPRPPCQQKLSLFLNVFAKDAISRRYSRYSTGYKSNISPLYFINSSVIIRCLYSPSVSLPCSAFNFAARARQPCSISSSALRKSLVCQGSDTSRASPAHSISRLTL